MCGIAGQISFARPVEHNSIQLMNDAQRHRGPDGEGVFVNKNATVGFGHRRLSFLDLSPAGKQPMQSKDESLCITYNGEIYNYIELKSSLESFGYSFTTGTDTEVILCGYQHWGSAVLQKLKGMFAFAIWSEKTRQLFLARDRFGIKPVYYYFDKKSGNFVFASEIKGVKANPTVSTTLNPQSVSNFFTYRYVPSPGSIWNEINKLPPAHFLTLDFDGRLTTQEYWKISFENRTISDKEAIERFDELLITSVKTHARSDVPVGSFLSGGYDSSAIVYYMSRFGYTPPTFAIGFEGWDVSEHLYAAMVAERYHTDHHALMLEAQSLDLLEKMVYVFDEPNADISTIPTYLISKEASKYVKAVMSGEGSDEMLVGYQWQKDFCEMRHSLGERVKLFFSGAKKQRMLSYYAESMAMGRFNNAELGKLFQPEFAQQAIPFDSGWWYNQLYRADLPELKAMQLMDIKHFMGELVLAKIDRASMANSLEVRVPFLDHEIVEFVMSLSPEVYYRKDETKHLLYQNIKEHMPREILHRKKQGFVGPDRYYMNYEWYRERLSDSALANDGLINATYIQQLLNDKDHWRLWKVAVMELWYRQWVKG